ncbi:MAG: gliding motility-associated C-terminal domain-containing protein [Bacteroidetes bacterium]|nr:gliding motility-associated C-terminal domain-containing protein [Bacteroidota bacterium]
MLFLALAPYWAAMAQTDNGINLVLNPSFETNTGCNDYNHPDHKGSYFKYLPHWRSAALGVNAPRYWNFDTVCNLIRPYFPNYNHPRTGTSCIFLSLFYQNYSKSLTAEYQIKTFLRGELAKPLVRGRKYFLSFHAVLDQTWPRAKLDYGINSLGCYVHSNDFSFNSSPIHGMPDSLIVEYPHQLKPQVRCSPDRFITDSVHYREISGVFTANGGERYITVGNFTPNAITEYRLVPKSGNWGEPHCLMVVDDFTLIPYPDLGPDTCLAGGDTLVLRVPGYIHLPPSAFTWSTGHTGDSLVVGKTGVYWVEYSEGYTTVRDTIRIQKTGTPIGLRMLKRRTSACEDSLALTMDSTRFSNFKWSTGHTGPRIFVRQKGNYSVSYQGANGCRYKSQTTVSFPKPWVEAIDSQYCFHRYAELKWLKIRDGKFDYLAWQDNTRNGKFKDRAIGDSAGANRATVWDTILVVAHLDGCTYTDTLFSRVFPWGIPNFQGDQMICNENQIWNVNEPSPGKVGARTKVLWSTGSTDSFIRINRADTYWVRTETARGGCVYTDTAYLGYSPFSVRDRWICRGDTVSMDLNQLLPFGKGFENPPVKWTYNGERFDFDWFTSTKATLRGAGTYTYLTPLMNMEHEPPYSCLVYDTFDVFFDTIKNVLPADTTICNSPRYRLVLREVFDSVSWAGNLDFKDADVWAYAPFGSFAATAYRNGCVAHDTMAIIADSLLYAVVGPKKVCPGGTTHLRLAADPGTRWAWGNDSLSVLAGAGTHGFYVYNSACGVHDTITISLFVLDTLIDPFGQDTFCALDSPMFYATSSGAWFELDGDSVGPSIRLEDQGYFHVTLNNKCHSLERFLLVNDRCAVLSVPTAFSPNGDGLNDYFGMVGLDYISFSCNIYAPNGQLLATGTNPELIWDGKVRDDYAPLGNYFFVARIVADNGEESELSGCISVVR